MKITEISYRALRTGHGYNNTSVEARAVIEDSDTPEKALAELRFWVDRQVDETLKREDAYESLEIIGQKKAWAQHELETLQKRANAYRDLLRERSKLAELARQNGMGGDALLLDTL